MQEVNESIIKKIKALIEKSQQTGSVLEKIFSFVFIPIVPDKPTLELEFSLIEEKIISCNSVMDSYSIYTEIIEKKFYLLQHKELMQLLRNKQHDLFVKIRNQNN